MMIEYSDNIYYKIYKFSGFWKDNSVDTNYIYRTLQTWNLLIKVILLFLQIVSWFDEKKKKCVLVLNISRKKCKIED